MHRVVGIIVGPGTTTCGEQILASQAAPAGYLSSPPRLAPKFNAKLNSTKNWMWRENNTFRTISRMECSSLASQHCLNVAHNPPFRNYKLANRPPYELANRPCHIAGTEHTPHPLYSACAIQTERVSRREGDLGKFDVKRWPPTFFTQPQTPNHKP